MGWNDFVNMLMNDLIRPALVIIIPAILIIVKSYADKIVNSVVEKNKSQTLCNKTTAQKNVMGDIGGIVEAAVCSNMDLADELKAGDPAGKLSRQKAEMLQTQAKTNIYNALDPVLKDDSLLDLVGGDVYLKTVIDGLLEKYVTEQKIKRLESKG